MQVQPGKEVRDAHWGARDTSVQLKDIQKKLPLRVLSAADWQHWITKGYVIVRKAVPKDNVDRLVDLLWRFDEKDPNDPSTWYAPQRREHRLKEINNAGMVEIFNHQYLWDNRQERRVYDAFVDIWDREDLWVGIDRANLTPPKKVPVSVVSPAFTKDTVSNSCSVSSLPKPPPATTIALALLFWLLSPSMPDSCSWTLLTA